MAGCIKKIQQPVIRSRPGLTGEVTRMTEDYFAPFTDIAVPSDRESSLSSEERRLQSLRNLAMSRIVKARKYKRKQSQAAQRRMTEAERIALEHARILEEREMRRARTEENRRMAEAGIQKMLEEANPENALLLKHILSDADSGTDGNINIDVPAEPEQKKEQKKAPGNKKKKKTKKQNKPEAPRTSKGGRYSRGVSASNPNRITTGGAIALGVLTGILIGTVIYGRVQTNEVYTRIAELQTEYDDLVAKNVSMKSEMEGKMTVKNIEEYAEKELGLRPLNQSQIVYIQLQTEDEVIVTEPEDNFFVTINDYLVGIWEFLRGR